MQNSDSKKLIQYQDVSEVTPELMKELVKRIVVYPDGVLGIEWNFKDELSKLVKISHIDSRKEVI